MAQDHTPADPSVVLDLMEAFRRSKTMFAAVSLGVFDAIEAGTRRTDELARLLQCDELALDRLLHACTGLGLLRRDGDLFFNTAAASAFLCRASPRRLTGYLNFSNEFMWKLWGNLEDAVREGGHRWSQTFGWDGPLFDNFFHSEHAKREFLMGMHGYGLISSPLVVSAFDLGRFRRLVDLGGATGHLAVAACQRYPQMQGVVFDLPAATPLARELVSATDVAQRVEVVSGDFFQDELPEGDLYALGRILHDWPEEKIHRLLARIVARLPSGGALLIAEKLLEPEKDAPRWALMQDLNMLTCTEGRERTLEEYEAILLPAGFTHVAGRRLAAPLDAVLATKA